MQRGAGELVEWVTTRTALSKRVRSLRFAFVIAAAHRRDFGISKPAVRLTLGLVRSSRKGETHMRGLFSLGVLLVLSCLFCAAQEALPRLSSGTVAGDGNPGASPSLPLQGARPDLANAPDAASPAVPFREQSMTASGTRFQYYIAETYGNPSLFTAPAFRASLRMANPPGKGTTRYPDEWRQGAAGFARNYGDAFATRISTHTAQFLTGAVTREDPHYSPSVSRNFFLRTSHALAFTFVDRSGSGKRSVALSNFVGAAAGGYVGNLYLPDGFRDMTHAGQRATFQFGMLAAGNLFREFAPHIPGPMRTLIQWIAR